MAYRFCYRRLYSRLWWSRQQPSPPPQTGAEAARRLDTRHNASQRRRRHRSRRPYYLGKESSMILLANLETVARYVSYVVIGVGVLLMLITLITTRGDW